MKDLLKLNICSISIWILVLSNTSMCFGQTIFFKMQQLPTDTISIQKVFSKNTILSPFKNQNPILSLGIKAKFSMNSQNSFARIVLSDKNGNEYLIFEGSKLFVDTDTFSLTDYAEETAILNGVIPDLIKIEIYDASIDFSQILISSIVSQKNISEADMHEKIAFNKKNQDSTKVERINKYLKNKGIKWIAKETSFSKLTYEQKKKRFSSKLPNLFGFEYYGGGVFEMPSAVASSMSVSETSTVVESFDWRNRHGQNWLTSVKNQGALGSCAVFAATGATEALVNLYYNRHIDPDLAEQNIISCNSTAEECLNGWNPA